MGVVIVDSEYESSAQIFDTIFNEVIELGQEFAKELLYLSENGFRDVLIDNAITEKSFKVHTALLNLGEASKDISGELRSFIAEADETDSYLY